MSRKRNGLLTSLAVLGLFFTTATAQAAQVAGKTPEERAINGAKIYLKAHNLKNVTLNVLANTLQATAIRYVGPEFEGATGIKLNVIDIGYTEIPTKMMAEAVAKSGAYDVIMHFADSIPDGAESKLLLPLNPWFEKYGPDLGGFLKYIDTVKYRGEVWAFPGDGGGFGLWARKDLFEDPKEKSAFQAKYGYELKCPETWEQLRDIAEFFTRDTDRDGKIDLYGHHDYRARKFASKWWFQRFLSMGKLPFDEKMNPLNNGPEGISATKQFAEIQKFMHPDVLGWGTAQHFPYWGSGHVATFLAWGSAISFARNPARKPPMKDKIMSCVTPGSRFSGRLIRRSIHWGVPTWMITRYGKHPELSYALSQWITSPELSAKFVAFPRGVAKPFRKNHLVDPRIMETYGKEFMEVNEKNIQVLAPTMLLVGFEEYMDALDVNLLDVILGKITAEEAMKRTASAWQKITDEVGRAKQIEAWKAQIPLYPQIDVPR